MLQASNISKEDMASNPQAVMDVLGFFAGNMDKKHRGEPSGIAIDEDVKNISFHDEKLGPLPELPSASKDNLKKVNVPPPPPPPIAAPIEAPPQPPVAEESTLRDKRRLSTMNDNQLMDALKAIVNKEDPTLLYQKIKNVGQG